MVFQKYPEIFQVPSHEPQIPHNYRVTPYPTNMQQYNVHPTSFEFDELLDITSNQTNNSMKKKVFLDKLTVPQLVKKFPALYATMSINSLPLIPVLSQIKLVHASPPPILLLLDAKDTRKIKYLSPLCVKTYNRNSRFLRIQAVGQGY